MRLRLGWATDPGLERAENEDSVLVWTDQGGVEALLVVCDGMGGHAAGRLASSLAIATFSKTLESDGGRGADQERLLAASAAANEAVYEASRDNPAWSGMGSTLTAVSLDAGRLSLVNVGDSPGWLCRGAEAELISEDHSWPAEQARLGIIRPEDVPNHPMRHRLTRAIGIWERIPAYAQSLALKSGDLVVVCSDGVETAGIGPEELVRLLGRDPEVGAKRVVERCLELGAPDNVTVAVAVVDEVPPDEEAGAMLGDVPSSAEADVLRTAVLLPSES
ncbi:MAG TPA: protein phosphatase 2C domain-containing protein [Candidatus Nitrosotalea sp.]|nr:protein phosphatase 2C domain-containing protein [Candidatus Nitrosotalea sp.]